MRKVYAILAASLAANLALVPVLWNEHLRQTYRQTVAHYKAKAVAPNTVFLGDSVTAGGYGFNRLDDLNLATSGLQTYQIAAALPEAVASYAPRHVVVMAGTNDAIEGPIDQTEITGLWQEICAEPRVLVTLATPAADPEINARINQVNAIAGNACRAEGRTVIALGQLRGPDGLMRPEYTVDGVHLSDAAYAVWRSALAVQGI